MSNLNIELTVAFDEQAPEPSEVIEALGGLLFGLGAHTVLTKLTNEATVVALQRRPGEEPQT